MKKGGKIFLCLFLATAAYAFTLLPVKQVNVVTMDQLKAKVVKPDNDTLYVVNFWATWCKPCIAEMPFFEAANKTFVDKKVKVVLVSLDFISDTARVNKFVEARSLQSTIYQLNGGNPNIWIDKIDPEWSGAIPATVMYKTGKKMYFREGDFTKTELDSLILTKIK